MENLANNIPTIDLSVFFRDGDEEAKKAAVESLGRACAEYGFFLATNHGIPSDLMSRAMELCQTFFGLADEEKLKSRPRAGGSVPAGYTKQPEQSPDKNEAALEEIFTHFSKTGEVIESIINDYLGLPPNFLKEYNNDRSWDWMNVKHYFPATEAENVGISSHKDGNAITFVFQDEVGGLEVLWNGQWIPIVPSKGTLVVNVLTNEKLKSALHRVTRPKGRSRYSISFFYNLQGDKLVEPFPHFTTQIGEPPKYKGFLYKDYQALRIKNKINPPYKEIDIDHFAII
ncbi:hypothetical protein DH2020_048292 [Rehmannia glutinosa]|uniref:Fe2OG dioxygenase domain-containing protein n=1 Tax=Rehmannia glutinosa TaxID=99300 RepID=A0ABR0U767_REHGL